MIILSTLYKYWLKLIGRYNKYHPWDNPFHNDPVHYCELYKDKGCAHVDGYLCYFPNCGMLKDYRKELERVYKLKQIVKNIKL